MVSKQAQRRQKLAGRAPSYDSLATKEVEGFPRTGCTIYKTVKFLIERSSIPQSRCRISAPSRLEYRISLDVFGGASQI